MSRRRGRHFTGEPWLLYLLLGIVAALTAAADVFSQARLNDLIKPVRLVAGRSDTFLVSDLFYSEEYDLTFKPNRNVSVVYHQTTQQLSLAPNADFEGYTALSFDLSGANYELPVSSTIKQKHVFRFQPETPPKQRMNLMGTFNSWNRGSLPMTDEDGDGVYEIELELDPGQYLYQFVEDDREFPDPQNPDRVDNGFGGFNSVVQVPPRHEDKAFLHVLGYEVLGHEVRLAFFFEHENKPEPLDSENVLALIDNHRLDSSQIEIIMNRILIQFDLEDLVGDKTLRLVVTQHGHASNLQTVHLRDGVPLGGGEFATWQDGIMYSIMIDRFFDGDVGNTHPVKHDSLSPKANYMGGDLQGIIEKLEAGYFDSLGVNTLWLSPVNQNTNHTYREWPPPHRYFSAYHGYWPTDHEKVEERFGSLDLLKQLVRKAQERGMRVLLDFIANHVHEEHPFFRDHRDWFGTYDLPGGRKNIRLWDEFRLTTWFEPFLPSFDYLGSAAALAAMTDNAVWWLQQTGADGFRHDAVKHVPNEFWRTLTQKVKKEVDTVENRKTYQIGETFGGYDLVSSYVNNGQLDAQFNFNLYDTAVYIFLKPESDFAVLARELEKTFSVYGVNHLMGNVMDSHDKIRYMAYADGDLAFNSPEAQEVGWSHPPQVDHESSYAKARLYLAYLMTIPGVPTIYYGDEIGMTGAADPDNRRMMRFDGQLSAPEQRMLKEVRRIVQLRRNHSALRYGDFQTLLANKHCFVYLRSDMHERVLVALNKNEIAQTIEIALPDFYEITAARSLSTRETYAVAGNRLRLTVSGIGWQIVSVN